MIPHVLWQFYSYRAEARNPNEVLLSLSMAFFLREGRRTKVLVNRSQIQEREEEPISKAEREGIFEIGKPGVDFES
jgi:hypothetical protein